MDASHEFALAIEQKQRRRQQQRAGLGSTLDQRHHNTQGIRKRSRCTNVENMIPNAAKQSAAVVCIAECPTQQQKTARNCTLECSN